MMRTDVVREQLKPVEMKIMFLSCLQMALNACSNSEPAVIPDEAIENTRRALEFAAASKPPTPPINRQ
jgi:hypothetical protein